MKQNVSMKRLLVSVKQRSVTTSAGGMTKSPPNSRFCKYPAIWREVGFDQGWYKDGDGDVQLWAKFICLGFCKLG